MTLVQKLVFSVLSIIFITLLILAVTKEKNIKSKYNIIIFQDKHRYATDKFEITTDGIKFIDNNGKYIYIKGNYIIEKKK